MLKLIEFQKLQKCMGQENKPASNGSNIKNDLLLVDQQNQVYMNANNKRFYQKYDLLVYDIADVEYELNIFNFRRITQKYVVSVDYCYNTCGRQFCASLNSFSYFIQKHDFTLFQKTEIRVKQGLKLILHVLKGFEILYKQFGYFTPNSKLIYFNRANEAKVWINENLKITKNVQFSHCPQSLLLENNLIRQLIRLFDALRDPSLPLFRYSQNLPNNLLTFKEVFDTFLKKIEEFQIKERNEFRSPQRSFINSTGINIPVQLIVPQNSSLNSPQNFIPNIVIQHKSPQCRNVSNLNSARVSVRSNLQQFKEAVSTSLKNTTNKNGIIIQKYNLSKDISSTMPASLKNSRIVQRFQSTQGPSPRFKRSDIDHKEIFLNRAAQIYSETEQTSFGRGLSPKPQIKRTSFITVEDLSNYLIKDSKNSNKIVFQSIMETVPPKIDFQVHKRHKTDIKLFDSNGLSSNSNYNKKSAIDAHLDNFNINTIKSIHLLDQDKQADSDIIVDLKNIINKYKQIKLN